MNTHRFVPRKLLTRLIIACVLSLAVTSVLLARYFQFSQKIERDIKTYAHETALKAAKQINEEMAKMPPIADAIARDLSNGTLPYTAITTRLKKETKANPTIYALGAAFEKNAYHPEVNLYAPYYVKNKSGTFDLVLVEKKYDYTLPPSDDPDIPDTRWYDRPLKNGAMWNEPYFGVASQTFLAKYSAPFYKKVAGGSPAAQGVIFASYDLSTIQNLMDSLKLGKTGYGFLISPEGKFIAHPLFETYVKGGKTIHEVMNQHQDKRFKTEISKALAGEEGIFSYKDAITGQSAWMVYAPIVSTEWSLGVVYIKEVSESDLNQLGHQQMWILIFGLIFIFLAMAVELTRRSIEMDLQKQEKVLWNGVTTFSVLCLVALAGIWSLVLSGQLNSVPEGDVETEEVIIVDQVGLDQYLKQKTRIFKDAKEPIVMVPTGVFVQSLEFVSSNNVFLTGYIWQKYTDGVHDGLSRGFVLPEAVSNSVTEAYRRKEGDTELIGWYFEVSLRQDFDYSKYPFDDVDVWIRLWHEDFDKNVILTPDLVAYRSLYPTSMPGVEESFVLNGWDLDKSYFNYQTHKYNVNFGIENYVGQEDFPELYFNIEVKRNFLNAFVGYLSPLMVVAFMIFGILLTFTRRKELGPLSGYNAMAALGACAGLFFLVLLGHIQLRDSFGVPQIMYLEYFYFVMYFMILGVSVYSLIFSNSIRRMSVLNKNDGQLIKLLFWPVMLVSMVAITFMVFY